MKYGATSVTNTNMYIYIYIQTRHILLPRDVLITLTVYDATFVDDFQLLCLLIHAVLFKKMEKLLTFWRMAVVSRRLLHHHI